MLKLTKAPVGLDWGKIAKILMFSRAPTGESDPPA